MAPGRFLRRWPLRRVLVVALVLLGVAWLVNALRPAPVQVEIARARRGRFVVTVEEEGMTRVRERYLVTAPVSGSMARIELRAGDPVRAGQVVARVEPARPPLLDVRSEDEARARVAEARARVTAAEAGTREAKAAYAAAQREAERLGQLYRRDAGTRQEFDKAKDEERRQRAALDAAKSQVRAAEAELAAALAALRLPGGSPLAPADVLAPVDGVVLRVVREDAGIVAAGTALAEVGDTGTLEVEVDLLSTDAARVREGAPATVHAWGGPPLGARVHRVERSGFTRVSALGVDEQRVNVILHFDESPPAALGDRFRVEASIVVAELEDAIAVPTGSVFRSEKGWAAWVVEDGRARRREVVLGERRPLEMQVVSGIRAGEAVVVYPPERIEEGLRVRELAQR